MYNWKEEFNYKFGRFDFETQGDEWGHRGTEADESYILEFIEELRLKDRDELIKIVIDFYTIAPKYRTKDKLQKMIQDYYNK